MNPLLIQKAIEIHELQIKLSRLKGEKTREWKRRLGKLVAWRKEFWADFMKQGTPR